MLSLTLSHLMMCRSLECLVAASLATRKASFNIVVGLKSLRSVVLCCLVIFYNVPVSFYAKLSLTLHLSEFFR